MNHRANAEEATRPVLPAWHPDWLSATVAVADVERQRAVVQDIARMFQPLTDGEEGAAAWESVTGHHGYTRATALKAWPGVRVQWRGSSAQGIHLTVSGKPLAALAAAVGPSAGPWPGLSHLLAGLARMHHPVSYPRVDIAWDNEKLSPAALMFQLTTGGLVTRLRRVQEHSSNQGGKGTIALGNRAGEVFVRCYDKAAEMARGDRVLMAAYNPWLRLETEFHDDRAGRVVDAYLTKGVPGVMVEVDNVVSFRNKEDDPNPTRRSWQDWWAVALGEVAEKVARPPKPTRDVDLDARLSWLQHAGSSIMADLEAERGMPALQDFLAECVVVGRTRRQLDAQKRGRGKEHTLPEGD